MKNTIHHFIEQTAMKYPDKVALQIKEGEDLVCWTYAQLVETFKKQSEQLKSWGISPGDRVILLVEQHPSAIIAYLAILQARATVVSIDTKQPEDILKSLIEFSVAKLALADKKSLSRVNPSMLGALPLLGIQDNFECQSGYSNKLNRTVEADHYRDEKIASIIFSSGTMGSYKGVELTHDAILSNIIESIDAIELSPDDIGAHLLPFYHIYPLSGILACLATGMRNAIFLLDDPQHLMQQFAEVKPSTMLTVPKILELFEKKITLELSNKPAWIQKIILSFRKYSKQINRLLPFNLSHFVFRKIHAFFGGKITRIVCGGAPLRKELELALESYGFNILQGYGLTETTGAIASNRRQEKRFGTVGKTYSNVEMKIDSLNKDQEGELCFRGKALMQGYFRNQSETEKVIKNGWFYSGDLGRVDKNGYLTIIGRIKEIIVTAGGKKSVPHIVESHYLNIDGVKDIAVVGILNEEQCSDEIHAAIVLLETIRADSQKVKVIKDTIYAIAKNLPFELRIQYIHIVSNIPRTNNLKVKRLLLKDQLQAGITKVTHTKADLSDISLNTPEDVRMKIIEYISNTLEIDPKEINDSASFVKYGFDSIEVLEFCMWIKEISGVEISIPLLWQYGNIQLLSHYIGTQMGLEKSKSPKELATMQASIALNNAVDLSQKAQLSDAIKVPGNSMELIENPTNIFVTGVTGYVGVYLVAELLRSTTATVHCLIRAENSSSGWKRLKAILQNYQLYDEAILSRVNIVIGNLSQERFGLDQKEYNTLADKIQVIYHSAARVNFVLPYGALEKANVNGTLEVIKFATACNLKPLHYISSTAAFFSQYCTPEQTIYEKFLDETPINTLMGGYTQTKWVAERLVTLAAERGIPVTIYRPATISPTYRHPIVFNLKDALVLIFLVIIKMKKSPNFNHVNINFSPIDYVVEAIVFLSRQQSSKNKVFHLSHQNPISYHKFIEYLEALSVEIKMESYHDWIKEFKSFADRDSTKRLATLQSIFDKLPDQERSWFETAINQPKFDCTETIRALEKTTIKCPEWTEPDWIPKMLHVIDKIVF